MNDKKNNMQNSNLSDLFKEVQDIRYGRAKPKQTEIPKEEIKFNKIYVIDKRFNAIGAIIGILFLILFSTAIHSNYIFATTTEEEKKAIDSFEENDDQIDIMNIISSNISELTTKEIITKELQIEYETKYIDNDKLPKGEEKIVQPGKFGYKDQTVIKTYENDQIIDENIINEEIKSNPVDLVIEVGTSEFLFNKKVHLGDTMYTTSDINLYNSSTDRSEALCMIYENIDVKLISEENGWARVSVDEMEGFVKQEYLTSEALNPGIAEISRKKRISLSLSFEMALNKPSGFTKEDFIKVLSGNPRDVNHIFEGNATFFYDIEQKYNVNGIFIASIGIHESAWGTSNIASQKKNLFGYGSYDASAFASSYTFESYQYGIELLAKALSKYYLNEQGTVIYDGETAVGSYYNGPTVSGVNVRYASDKEWANKVYNTMVALYNKL